MILFYLSHNFMVNKEIHFINNTVILFETYVFWEGNKHVENLNDEALSHETMEEVILVCYWH